MDICCECLFYFCVLQAVVKVLQLVVQDLERERRGKNGVENLARAFKQSPNFGNVDSQQNVSEKLHHVSMTTKTKNRSALFNFQYQYFVFHD